VSAWSLGIDFGTSYTAAAVSEGTEPRAVDVEGDGQNRMASATYAAPDGTILVGDAARREAANAPERYEPTPKRAFGDAQIFLGEGLVDVADLAGAVLRRVYDEARRQQGGGEPEAVRVTYPAAWAEPRRAVLVDACTRAGLGNAELMPEPIAAALRLAAATTPAERHIAVFDWGGGTFEASILLRTADGFEVAGPPVGRDPLGGEDIDQRVISYLGELLAPDHAEQWERLRNPPDAQARRDNAELRAAVERAKETLSDTASCELRVPGIGRDVQVTRKELEDLISDHVDATVDALELALRDAGVAAGELAGIYLVGGSSRIPLVAHRLQGRFGVVPTIEDDPKSVVASGAASPAVAAPPPPAPTPAPPAAETAAAPPSAPAAAAGPAPATEAAAPSPAAVGGPPAATAPAAAPAGETRRFSARLTMTLLDAARDRCVGQLVVERPGAAPLAVRAHDEPARGIDTAALARAALDSLTQNAPGFTSESSGPAAIGGREGLELRYSMTVDGRPVAMFERYLVLDDRALVIGAPVEARAIADAIALSEPDAGAPAFRMRFDAALPEGWTALERVRLTVADVLHPVTAERSLLAGEDSPAAWEQRALDEVLSRRAAKLAGRTPARLLGELAGDIVSVTWREEGAPMITKLGLAATVGEALSVRITLPHADQALFPQLARRATLASAAAARHA